MSSVSKFICNCVKNGLRVQSFDWRRDSIAIPQDLQQPAAVTTQDLLCKGGLYEFTIIKSNQSELFKMQNNKHRHVLMKKHLERLILYVFLFLAV